MKYGILIATFAFASLAFAASSIGKTLTYNCGTLKHAAGGPILIGAPIYSVLLNSNGGYLLVRSINAAPPKTDSIPLALKFRGMESRTYIANDIQVDVMSQTMGISKKGPLVNIKRIGNSDWSATCKLVTK